MFLPVTVNTYRLKRFCLLYDRIQIVRDRNISIGVLCLGTANMQQAFLVIDISTNQINSFLGPASASEDHNKQKIRRILRVDFEKMFALVICNTATVPAIIFRKIKPYRRTVRDKPVLNCSLKKEGHLQAELPAMRI